MIGGNGQGFFQNIDDQTKVWLHECFGDRPFCINFPGGAEANLATPNPLLKGWGLTEENINYRFSAGGADEDGNGIEKWMEKLRQQNLTPRSYLYELKDLKAEFPNMEIIWKVNLITGDTEEAKSAFSIVHTMTGCTKVVLGNEVYAKNNFNFDFDVFIVEAEPFVKWLKTAYPDVEIAIPFAPDIDRPDHVKWNHAVAVYMSINDTIDAVDVHIYLTAEQLPEAFNSYPSIKIDYHPLEEYSQLQESFTNFSEEYKTDEKWDIIWEHIDINFNCPVWCTEFNIKPASFFCNTIAGGAYLFEKFMEWGEAFDVLCVHNLVAPDYYGCISRTNDIDYDQTTQNTRRVGYYALKFASEVFGMGGFVLADGAWCFFGRNVLWYSTLFVDEIYYIITTNKGLIMTPPQEHFISGREPYDSLGKVGFMSNVTEPFDPRMNIDIEQGKVYEIQNKELFEIEGRVGFGYVIVSVIEKKKEPKPCRRYWWQFWRRKCIETANPIPAV